MFRFRFLVLALVLALWLGVGGWAVSVVRPKAGVTLRVACSSIEDLCEDWARSFQTQTGVETTVVRLPSGQVLARLANSREAPEFDVWHGGTSDTYLQAARAGLLEAYVSPKSVEIPSEYKDPAGFWTGTYIGLLGFCSNVDLLAELGVPVPSRWDDLMDPRLAQEISMPDPGTSGTGYSTLWTQVQRFGVEQTATAWLGDLDDNVLQYTNSGLAPAGVVARGEAAVAVTFTQHCVKARLEGAKNLVVSYPVEGTGYEIGGVAIVKDSGQEGVAKKYVDFALSIVAQEASFDRTSPQIPTNKYARIHPQVNHLGSVTLLPYNPEAAAASRSRLLNDFEQVRRAR